MQIFFRYSDRHFIPNLTSEKPFYISGCVYVLRKEIVSSHRGNPVLLEGEINMVLNSVRGLKEKTILFHFTGLIFIEFY